MRYIYHIMIILASTCKEHHFQSGVAKIIIIIVFAAITIIQSARSWLITKVVIITHTSLQFTLISFLLVLDCKKRRIIVPKFKWLSKTESLWEKNTRDIDDEHHSVIFPTKLNQTLKKLKIFIFQLQILHFTLYTKMT